MRADLVIPDILPADDRLWVPLGDGIYSRPLQYNVTAAHYVDPDGAATGYDDVFPRLERAREHVGSCGLGADFVDQFVR